MGLRDLPEQMLFLLYGSQIVDDRAKVSECLNELRRRGRGAWSSGVVKERAFPVCGMINWPKRHAALRPYIQALNSHASSGYFVTTLPLSSLSHNFNSATECKYSGY